VLAGIHQPDSGTVMLDGKPVLIHGPAHARSLGIATVHQEPRLFPDLTVAENVFIGHALTGRFGSVNWRAMRRSADRIFESLSVNIDSSAIVRGLSMADQQLIEIAKALSIDARVLILDEPTASLSAHEVERLFAIVRQTRDRGVAVLFVSHRLEEVFELRDRPSRRAPRDHRPDVRADGSRPRPIHGRPVSLAVPEECLEHRQRAA
jgi:rhamnose transport system ATP-binding protein